MTKTKLTAGLLIAAAALPAGASAGYDEHKYGRTQGSTPSDLRSADAADAGANGQTLTGKVPPVAHVETSASAGDGFDWGDAGIGASAMIGLLAVGGGTYMVLGAQRRRGHVRPA